MKDPNDKPTKYYAKYSGLVFQMIAIIGGFAWGGHYLDNLNKNETPWYTVIACLLGVSLSIYQIIKEIND